jgi:Tol biopolymer transport system component
VERLTISEYHQSLTSWSPDGKWLIFYQMHPKTYRDIWVLPIGGEPFPFLITPFQEAGGMFSPDGRWLAYVSDESGRYEVYVQSFPGPGGKWQISTEGGDEPVWARNGRKLFYRNADQMMVVDITIEPSFSTGTPRRLFEGPYVGPRGKNFSNYDIAPNGQHFLMLKTVEQQESSMTQIHVVLNWFEELKRIVTIND